MQLGPQHALLTVEIRFQRALNVQELEAAIARIKQHIRELEPTVEHAFIEPGPLTGPAATARAA